MGHSQAQPSLWTPALALPALGGLLSAQCLSLRSFDVWPRGASWNTMSVKNKTRGAGPPLQQPAAEDTWGTQCHHFGTCCKEDTAKEA